MVLLGEVGGGEPGLKTDSGTGTDQQQTREERDDHTDLCCKDKKSTARSGDPPAAGQRRAPAEPGSKVAQG